MFIFLVSLPPGGVDPWQCTSEKGKEAPGEKLPALTPVPDGVEFGQRHEPVNTNSPQAESPIQVREKPAAFHRRPQ
jgi:hypothetical protein